MKILGLPSESLSLIAANGRGYELLCVLALNFASTHQTENLKGFLEVGENKQLLIAIVAVAQP